MAGKEGGQRQAHHVAHGDIKEDQQKAHTDPQAGALAAGGPRRGLGGGAGRGARWTGAVAGRGHGPADLCFGELAIVIFYQHAVLHQINSDGRDPRQCRDRPLHMGAAGGTAHAGHIKALLHKTPPPWYILRHYYKKGGA